MSEEKLSERLCPICKGSVEIRNPIGLCDHLYYPDTLDPSKLLSLYESLEAENQGLKEQNEKLFRKFKRIPATIADAYNTNVELESRLSKAQLDLNKYQDAGMILAEEVNEALKIIKELNEKNIDIFDPTNVSAKIDDIENQLRKALGGDKNE